MKTKKERSEEVTVPAKGEVMGGQSKACIAKWESLGVKCSLNIRFGVAGRAGSDKLRGKESHPHLSKVSELQLKVQEPETQAKARSTGRTQRAQGHQPQLLSMVCCEPGHADAPISSEYSKSALVVQGSELGLAAQGWEALSKGSAKTSFTYRAVAKAPRKIRDP